MFEETTWEENSDVALHWRLFENKLDTNFKRKAHPGEIERITKKQKYEKLSFASQNLDLFKDKSIIQKQNKTLQGLQKTFSNCLNEDLDKVTKGVSDDENEVKNKRHLKRLHQKKRQKKRRQIRIAEEVILAENNSTKGNLDKTRIPCTQKMKDPISEDQTSQRKKKKLIKNIMEEKEKDLKLGHKDISFDHQRLEIQQDKQRNKIKKSMKNMGSTKLISDRVQTCSNPDMKTKTKKRKPNKRNKYKHLLETNKNELVSLDRDKLQSTTSESTNIFKTKSKSDKILKSEEIGNKIVLDISKEKSHINLSVHPIQSTNDNKNTNFPQIKKLPYKLSTLKKIFNEKVVKNMPLGHNYLKQDQNIENFKIITVHKKKICDQQDSSESLHDKMLNRLNSAHFRYINEMLYTSTGREALQMFSENPQLFQVYHQGYQNQMSKWPVNPVDKIIEYIKAKPASLIIADFGCGDAKIKQSVSNKVHCFDLVAQNEYVTVCDMAKVPIKASSVDIAVFCLSLMGTNFVEYIMEANRVLKFGGLLKVAEIISRIENSDDFIKGFFKLGFKLNHKDMSSKMFSLFEFKKINHTKDIDMSKQNLVLLPCLYKKR